MSAADASGGSPPTDPDTGSHKEDPLPESYLRPIATGWRLWFDSLGPLVILVALPTAMVFLLLVAADPWWRSLWPDGDWWPLIWLLPYALAASFAVAVADVVLSRRLAGLSVGHPFTWAARRFTPWAATWLIVYALSLAGMMLFVFPGLWISLRLFWAPEFALLHDDDPLTAIANSWNLSRGVAGEILGVHFKTSFTAMAVWFPVFIIWALVVNILRSTAPPGPLSTTVTVVIVTVGLVLVYGFTHACEIAYFYGTMEAFAEYPEDDHDADSVRRLHWARESGLPQGAPGQSVCPRCRVPYDPDDYRPDAIEIRCSICGELIPAEQRGWR